MARAAAVVVQAVLLCAAMALSGAAAARTHEAFAQSTYVDESSLPTPAKKPTTTTPTTRVEQTIFGSDGLPVSTSTSATSTSASQNMPTGREEQEDPQHYRDYRGVTSSYTTSAAAQGDFMPDAKPWWVNPQYASYGNPQQPQQSGDGGVPDRYPAGYDNPSASYSTVQHTVQPNQYSMIPHQKPPQASEYTQQSSILPYEMTGGGCPTQYWISNTQRWPAFFNVKTTVGEALGSPAQKVFGETTLLQGLLNTRTDGYSTLLRTGATAILNSYSRSQYELTHVQVIESFATALESNKAAAKQAATYEDANISSYTDQYNSCA